MQIEILGSGTSMGVPMVGCNCQVCRSDDPKDKRTRTSVFIEHKGARILIDTSSDYRQQMLRAGITDLDAVIYTHYHVDHILGMDDLRSLNILHRKSIPIYSSQETMQTIKRVFAYTFSDKAYPSNIPGVIPTIIDSKPFVIKDVEVVPIRLLHGKLPIFGFRIGDFAYCTDVSHIPESSYQLLQNLKILVLGALRYKTHPTHFSIEEALREASRIGAQQTFFTHLSHAVLHSRAESELPENVHLAYDGLRLTIDE
jgi:phosphoribosyl 1,2-cyclic phosphate phosphodiesterase